MKIYETRNFPNPRRVRMFAAEKGINDTIDYVEVNVGAGEAKSPEFLALNPDGAVPVLQLEDGTVITETTAISRYMEEAEAANPLFGKSPKESAKVDMWQRIAEDGLMRACGAYFHNATDGLGDDRDRFKDWGLKNKGTVRKTMERLDAHLNDNAYLAGDDFSIADITAFCGIDFAKFVDIAEMDDLTHLKSWYDRVNARPSAAA